MRLTGRACALAALCAVELVSIAAVSGQTITVSPTVKAVLDAREDAVTKIAADATTMFYKRCDADTRSCTGDCQRPSCGADPDIKGLSECTAQFGGASACEDNPEKSQVIRGQAGVRVAPGATFDNEIVREDTCTYRNLDKVTTENDKNVPGLMWQYFGTSNGVFRMYPYVTRSLSPTTGQCREYDPRYRPWYVAAASGAKNVVIVVDMSGSMTEKNRAALARDAARSVVETLSATDYVAVMSFSGKTNPVKRYPTRGMVQANAKNLEAVEKFINNMVPVGSTDFNNGFTAAFDALDEAHADETFTNCMSTILFLTDGIPSEADNVNKTLTTLKSRNVKKANTNGFPAFIFTYSLGSGADLDNMRTIACANRGIWTPIQDNGDLRTAMLSYYQLLAAGIDNEGVIWSEPYPDSTTGLEMVTVAKTAYDKSVDPPYLIGIAGVDLLMRDITALGNADNTLKYLLQKSGACATDFNLTDCQMQELRKLSAGTQAMCPGITCPAASERVAKCSTGVASAANVFCTTTMITKEDYIDQTCCSDPSNAGLIAGVVGGVIGGLVFFGILCFCCSKCCKAKPKAPPASAHPPAATPVAPQQNAYNGAPQYPYASAPPAYNV